MAFAFLHAGKPAVDALFVPDLSPALMEKCRDWDRAHAIGLVGFGGAPAQGTELRALWNDDWLFFAFTCSDNAIISPGSEDGLDHYRLGDTVEVFIARRGAKNYAELHATPAGRKTWYFCSDYRQPSDPPPAAVTARVVAAKTLRGWRAFLAVPREMFGRAGESNEYDIFFGRYDYTASGARPALSSYPAQHGDKPDFHRREDYAILCLKS